MNFNYIVINKISFILFLIIGLLLLGCNDPAGVKNTTSESKESTLSSPDLNGSPVSDYFYNFEEDIDVKFLYYSLPYYEGMSYNTIQSPETIDLERDVFNYKTFPEFLLNITPGYANINTRLYPLNESDASENNWCDTLLLQYNGSCDSKVDFNGDSYKVSTGKYLNKQVKRDTSFIIHWDNIDSLKWLRDKDRFDVVLENTKYDTAKVSYDDLTEPDLYDSLIYIGVIDTMRTAIDNLLIVDRSEWERFDTTYEQSDYSIILSHTFNYEQIKISKDSLMFRVNSDCNQNGLVDLAEEYRDWGSDWCPDSLETGDGICIAVDAPCNCLGNWMVGSVTEVNSDWQEAKNNGYDQDSKWWHGEHWRSLDPNGDRWRDCGCDGLCYSDSDWSGADPGDSEGNGITDCDENTESNAQYDYNVQALSGEYFIDIGNDVVDEAEFCSDIGAGPVCNGEFEDKNCNGKWDPEETESNKTSGNGLRDSAETWRDDDGDNEVDPNEIYYMSEKMESYLVNHPISGNPVAVEGVTMSDTVRVKYLSGAAAVYVVYDSLIYKENIQKKVTASYKPIDSVRTIYTNKIIESKLDGQGTEYFITKSSWYEPVSDDFGGRDYDYDYHIFNTDVSQDKIVKLVHPKYFKHYGFETDLKKFEDSFFQDNIIQEEIYLYTPFGQIRDGEYYYSEDTLVTRVANYHMSDEYKVSRDNSVPISIRKVLHDQSAYESDGSIVCLADNSVSVSKISDCPRDSIITNSYKITRTKVYTMIGNGVEFGFRNTFWVGRDDVKSKPMGIIKDKIEYRWTEAPWEVSGEGWKEYSRLELYSLELSGADIQRKFNNVNELSLDQMRHNSFFETDPFILSSSYGMHRIRKYFGE